jgi:hypothetical protein
MEKTKILLLEQMADSSKGSMPINRFYKESSFEVNFDTPDKAKCNFIKGALNWVIDEVPDSFGLYVKKERMQLPYNSYFYIANVPAIVSKIGEKYYIKIYTTPEITQQCTLDQNIHIGYSYDENDIVINSKYVSRKHLAIQIRKDNFELIENPICHPTNATWVKQTTLKINENREIIKIGVHKFFRVSLTNLHDAPMMVGGAEGTTTDVNTFIICQKDKTHHIGDSTNLLSSIPHDSNQVTQEMVDEWTCKNKGETTPKWAPI